MIREGIEQAVKDALQSLGVGEVSFVVERPGSLEHGDYATNAALAAAKALKKNPREVADILVKELSSSTSLGAVSKIETAGAGFINFFVSHDAIAKEVSAAAQEQKWGSNDLYKGKTVMVEYTDPNPFKEFHIGHLMSNAIGEAIARVLETAGAKVIRANYQGDVGLHVAKTIWAVKNKKVPGGTWGEAYVVGNAAYESEEGAKKEINEINKKIYDRSDSEINEMYDTGRKVSLAHFEEIYKILGTKFDTYFFESETTPLGIASVQNNPEVFEESEDARVFKGEDEGLHTRVFLTSQGLPTYEAKDLGLLDIKSKIDLDTSITVTASEQKEYFKVVLAAAKHIADLKEIAERTLHVTHGMMRFAEGKMSSRKGNVITGESLLEDLKDAAKVKMQDRDLADTEHVAKQVAVGAIKYVVLKQGSGKDIIFDPEKSLSIEGDSGPYLQYAHTRALSLIKMAEKEGIQAAGESDFSAAGLNGDATKSDSPAANTRLTLERTLLHFPDALLRAAKELEPHYVTTYLTELASAFNSWYANERVIGGNDPHYGVLLAEAVEKTLAKGLHVLGIPAPEKM